MLELTDTTRQLIGKLFNPVDVAPVEYMLVDECGNNLPWCEKYTPEMMERIRFSVLKEARGDINILTNKINLAKLDWRDSLVNAGFADDIHSHELWAQEVLKDTGDT